MKSILFTLIFGSLINVSSAQPFEYDEIILKFRPPKYRESGLELDKSEISYFELQYNEDYQFRIRAVDSGDRKGTWSSWSTVDLYSCEIPSLEGLSRISSHSIIRRLIGKHGFRYEILDL